MNGLIFLFIVIVSLYITKIVYKKPKQIRKSYRAKKHRLKAGYM